MVAAKEVLIAAVPENWLMAYLGVQVLVLVAVLLDFLIVCVCLKQMSW